MPKKIFGAERDEVVREWRGLCNEEFHDLYSLPDIIQVIKSKKMRWVGHVAFSGEERGAGREVVRVT